MDFDYSKLSGKIKEKFDTRDKFAKAMGWSTRTLSLKMSGSREWKQKDIRKAMQLLGLIADDIPQYFFTLKVQNIELSKGFTEISEEACPEPADRGA